MPILCGALNGDIVRGEFHKLHDKSTACKVLYLSLRNVRLRRPYFAGTPGYKTRIIFVQNVRNNAAIFAIFNPYNVAQLIPFARRLFYPAQNLFAPSKTLISVYARIPSRTFLFRYFRSINKIYYSVLP